MAAKTLLPHSFSTQPFPRKPFTARQFMAGFSSAGNSGGFSKSESVNPNRTPNCSNCHKPESEHGGHGDWCPSESEDQIWSSTRKFSRSHLQVDGIRISPLFRVFVSLLGALKPWRVCGTNLEGDPVSQHSEHSSLRQALNEASRANQLYAGIKPNFPTKVVKTNARRVSR